MAVAHNFTEIPTIDLSQISSPEKRPELLKQLRHALVSIGFLYVSNHGVPSNVIQDLIDILPKIFSLSDSAKEETALSNSPHFLGFSSIGSETTGGKADKREQVEFATELTAVNSVDAPLYEKLRGPNQVRPCSTLSFCPKTCLFFLESIQRGSHETPVFLLVTRHY